MKERIRRVFERFEVAPDALILANAVEPHLDQSFFYVFDAASGLFEGSIAVAHPDGKLDLITNALEEESARVAAKSDPDVAIHVPNGPAERDEAIRSVAPKQGTIALNFRELTHETFRSLEKLLPGSTFLDATQALQKTRVIKDSVELARIGEAATIASQVARTIPSMFRTGKTELEIAAEIEFAMGRAGASGRSFATIVGFGAHSAEPHYSPNSTALASGMSIVCDFGAFHQRYASDCTRSFRFGAADAELKQVHETVLAAQNAALAIIRPGVGAREVHMAAQKVIDATPWKGRFTHGLGHSLGLAVHDPGFALSPNFEEPLQPGMVLTVEPGIYLPGKGGVRIEDDIVVTDRGYKLLTDAPREYLEVPA
ncbi:MAG TPA: Xaa-Pro peptidase family protein [Thermoplasmata archaeon]|nr:Xaa-Pro peptidase family protein [Thermoplasmata archaeon]